MIKANITITQIIIGNYEDATPNLKTGWSIKIVKDDL